DQVLVIGTSAEGGVAAAKVFGGTRAEYRTALQEQRALIAPERVLGRVMMGLGLLLLVLWVALRNRRRLRGHRVTSKPGAAIWRRWITPLTDSPAPHLCSVRPDRVGQG